MGDTFKMQVGDIGHTLLILHPWNAPIPLSRAWCVWEMYCTADTGASFNIRLPPEDSLGLEQALIRDPQVTSGVIASIDTEKAEAWKQQDMEMIHAAVANSIGHRQLNSLVRHRLCDFIIQCAQFNERTFFGYQQNIGDRMLAEHSLDAFATNEGAAPWPDEPGEPGENVESLYKAFGDGQGEGAGTGASFLSDNFDAFLNRGGKDGQRAAQSTSLNMESVAAEFSTVEGGVLPLDYEEPPLHIYEKHWKEEPSLSVYEVALKEEKNKEIEGPDTIRRKHYHSDFGSR